MQAPSTVLPSSSGVSTDTAASGGTTTTTQVETQPASLITLEVSPRQAEQIVQGIETGKMWLSLNPPGFNPKTFVYPQEIVEALNLFDQPLSLVQSTLATIAQNQPTP